LRDIDDIKCWVKAFAYVSYWKLWREWFDRGIFGFFCTLFRECCKAFNNLKLFVIFDSETLKLFMLFESFSELMASKTRGN
jgi:hypothetical protein